MTLPEIKQALINQQNGGPKITINKEKPVWHVDRRDGKSFGEKIETLYRRHFNAHWAGTLEKGFLNQELHANGSIVPKTEVGWKILLNALDQIEEEKLRIKQRITKDLEAQLYEPGSFVTKPIRSALGRPHNYEQDKTFKKLTISEQRINRMLDIGVFCWKWWGYGAIPMNSEGFQELMNNIDEAQAGGKLFEDAKMEFIQEIKDMENRGDIIPWIIEIHPNKGKTRALAPIAHTPSAGINIKEHGSRILGNTVNKLATALSGFSTKREYEDIRINSWSPVQNKKVKLNPEYQARRFKRAARKVGINI